MSVEPLENGEVLVDEPYCVVYIDESDRLLEEKEVLQSIIDGESQNPSLFSDTLRSNVEQIRDRLLRKKGFEGSTQDTSELGATWSLTDEEVVEPPYPPECFANFLEADETLFRCVVTKVSDAVCRPYSISPTRSVRVDDTAENLDEATITRSEFLTDKRKIERFIRGCHKIYGFRGVITKAAMDYENVGWGAVEVVRAADKTIVRLEHIPASRIRVLRGWAGFIERWENGDTRYYQVFGEKVGKLEKDPITGRKVFREYDPDIDGPNLSEMDWNLRHFKTGEATNNFLESANEVLFFPKIHANTIYYGYTDTVPAVGAILANSYIRDYLLQFFEHNTVPRYAVIIKGAKIDDEFRKMIVEYFKDQVKGAAHKTLVLTLNSIGGKSVDVEFKALDATQKEGDFLKTRQEKSQQIQTAHGVSPAILGIVNNSELGSGKGLSQAEIYKDRIVTPSQDYWEDRLNRLFSLGLGVVNAGIQFSPLDIRDELMRAQIHQIYTQIGAETLNEVRQLERIGGPLDGGDTPFVRIREGSAFKVVDIPNIPGPGGAAEDLLSQQVVQQDAETTVDEDSPEISENSE